MEDDGLTDITVPRPHAHVAPDADATIPVPRAGLRRDRTQPPSMPTAPAAPPLDRATVGSAPTPLALPAGFQLFEYRIDSVLGQGGFGITYLATDINLHVRVAIKEYLPASFATRDPDRSVSPRWPEDNDAYLNGLESFLVEARTLAAFRHPNIVRVARFFEAHKTAYMVLEYERGQPLKTWWPAQRALGEARLLALLQPLLDGLALVHEAGYLHRDIKPDNIYVRKDDGSFVLLDFGAARQSAGTQALADVVTPGYAPPEQFAGSAQGPWTDLYALAATLYWMIGGAKPPPAPDRQSGTVPMAPALVLGRGRYSEAFLQAVDTALSLDPAARPRTVHDFARALCAAHAGSLGLEEALRLGEAQAQQRFKKGVRKLGRALWRPASWPLAVRMTAAMVLAALLPMTMTAYYNLHGAVQAVSSAEKRNLENLARGTADRIGQLLDDTRIVGSHLADDPPFATFLAAPTVPAQAAMAARLADLVDTHTEYQLIALIDRAGKAVAVSDPAAFERNFDFRPLFGAALAGKPVMTGLIIGSAASASGAYYAHPVTTPDGRVLGALVLRIKGTLIAGMLNEMALPDERAPFMVDGDGILVHHPDRERLHQSLAPLPPERAAAIAADARFRRDHVGSLDMPTLAAALAGPARTGNISYRSTLSGEDEHAGFARVPNHDWVVGVTEKATRFEAPLHRLFANVLASVAIVGIVFSILALLFARSITRPVVRLTDAARALQEGDYDRAHIRVTSNDEIGRLARTFNVMIDVLRQQGRERRRGRESAVRHGRGHDAGNP